MGIDLRGALKEGRHKRRKMENVKQTILVVSGKEMAKEFGVPFLGKIPMEPTPARGA